MQHFFCPSLRSAPPRMRGAHLSADKSGRPKGLFAWTPGLQIEKIEYGTGEYNDKNLQAVDLNHPFSPGADAVWFQVTPEHLLVLPNDACEVKLVNGLEIVVLTGARGRKDYIVALDFGSGCHLRLTRADDGTVLVAEQTPSIRGAGSLCSLEALMEFWTTELAGTMRSGPV